MGFSIIYIFIVKKNKANKCLTEQQLNEANIR